MARGRPSRATVYARLDAAITDLQQRLGGLPAPNDSAVAWADTWHLEAHHSTALEGNTLVLREVRAVLDTGRAVGAKPLRDYLEVQGYGEAARWVYRQGWQPDWQADALITVTEVRHVHELAMTPAWQASPHPGVTGREGPGMFREHDIRPFTAGMTPPAWPIVPARMQDWVDRVTELAPLLADRSASATPLPEHLAEIHSRFEQVHPFIDGNGRTGRLLLNLVLVRLGLPPVVVLTTQRSAYLAGLQRSDAGDHGPLGEILARAMYDSLNRFIVPAVAEPALLVPLTALADERFSVAALRQAAVRGRLDSVQGSDGMWRSSRDAVDTYARSRGRRSRREAAPS